MTALKQLAYLKVRQLGDRSAKGSIRNSDFNIDEEYEGKGVGKELFTAVVQRVNEHSYDQLLILGAHQTGKSFYEAVLSKLQEENLVKNFSISRADEYQYPAWNLRINF